jgi:hypothetical protein
MLGAKKSETPMNLQTDPSLLSSVPLLEPPPMPPPSPGIVLPPVEPWPVPVHGGVLLDQLLHALRRFVIFPKWGAETMALWILHTYAFELRDVTTYVGLESPVKRCGKTTLLSLLAALGYRALVSANISSSAFFRVIEEIRPTLLIDEADTFLQGNHELRGILNSGYTRNTAFVVRVASAPTPHRQPNPSALSGSALARFSCWCPKVLATIGHLPDTLEDRCIVLRMQRKTPKEKCERLRDLDPHPFMRQCLRFVHDHASAITQAQPPIPPGLNDRAADIWEPLLVLADLASSHWPSTARDAALALSSTPHEANPIGSLLLHILAVFTSRQVQRIFSRDLVAALDAFDHHPWLEPLKGKPMTELWLAQQLRPFGILTHTLRIGASRAKGYLKDDFTDKH